MRTVSPNFHPSAVEPMTRDITSITSKFLFGEMGPTRSVYDLSGFRGLTYFQAGVHTSVPGGATPVNFGNWEIGADKLATTRYLNARGLGGAQPMTLAGSDFYSNKQLSDTGRQFMEQAGGLENIILKKNVASAGTGVWMNAADLPQSVAEHFFKNPEEYLLQKKLDLAGEFRVITAGDKPIFMAHRFGSEGFGKKIGDFLKSKMPGFHWMENVEPVLNPKTRAGLSEFATKISRELPYEIGAFDIGLTRAGEFQLIEAQRSFGSISNPVVSRRLKYALTGKPGSGMIPVLAAGAMAAAATYGISSLFSAKDDNYNTIEGMRHGGQAQILRRTLTDFGSGWIYKLPKELSQLSFKGLAVNRSYLAQELTGMAKAAGILENKGVTEAIESFVGEVHSMKHLKKGVNPRFQEFGKAERVMILNPMQIELEAVRRNMSVKDVYNKVIRHEAFHLRRGFFKHLNIPKDYEQLAKVAGRIPERFKRAFGQIYKGHRIAETDGGLVEEWFANAIETAFDKGAISSAEQAVTEKMYKRAWDILGIRPLKERAAERAVMSAIIPEEAGRVAREIGAGKVTVRNFRRPAEKLVMAEQTRDTAQAAAVNGLMGGKGHITPHNKRQV